MEFVNETPYLACLIRGAPGDREMLGSVVVRQTFRVDSDGLDLVGADKGWPLFDKPFVFEGVRLQPEGDFRKSGLDVLLFGSAVASDGNPVRRLNVTVASGSFRAACTVTGDRVWYRDRGGVTRCSEPEPFLMMPLINARSYGGHATFGGALIPHMTNPAGRGYVWSEADAVNKALPNIEPAGRLVTSWEERPRPFCFHKPEGTEAAEEEFVATGREMMSPARLQALFSDAARDFRTSAASIGPDMTLTGMSPRGVWKLPLPPRYGPVCDVTVGARRGRLSSELSTLILLVEPMVLVVTYTARFRYLFVPHDLRRVVLR